MIAISWDHSHSICMAYEVEVIGVLLALELLHWGCRVHTASIKLDNQVVIQVLGVCSTKPA